MGAHRHVAQYEPTRCAITFGNLRRFIGSSNDDAHPFGRSESSFWAAQILLTEDVTSRSRMRSSVRFDKPKKMREVSKVRKFMLMGALVAVVVAALAVPAMASDGFENDQQAFRAAFKAAFSDWEEDKDSYKGDKDPYNVFYDSFTDYYKDFLGEDEDWQEEGDKHRWDDGEQRWDDWRDERRDERRDDRRDDRRDGRQAVVQRLKHGRQLQPVRGHPGSGQHRERPEPDWCDPVRL
jgi:hypothetical protein